MLLLHQFQAGLALAEERLALLDFQVTTLGQLLLQVQACDGIRTIVHPARDAALECLDLAGEEMRQDGPQSTQPMTVPDVSTSVLT